MNANELANLLEAKANTCDATEYGFEVEFEAAATMLRQKQAEIEALKDMLEEEGIGVSQKYLDERILERQEK